MNDWLEKCKYLKNGLKQTSPSEEISYNYLTQAENTLKTSRISIKRF